MTGGEKDAIIWEVQSEGIIILDYEDSAQWIKSNQSNNRAGLYVGLPFLLFVIIITAWRIVVMRKGRFELKLNWEDST